MSNEQLVLEADEEEDVVLVGSDLYQALTDMGYTNFDSVPKVPVESGPLNTELSKIKNYNSKNDHFLGKKDFVCQFVFEEHTLRREQLKAILESNILLDDHADMINEFLNKQQQTSNYIPLLEWLPLISSLASAAFTYFIFERKDITSTTIATALFGFSTYTKLKRWNTTRSLRHLVKLQNENHNYLKQHLKILRRTFAKKSKISQLHEKPELIGNEKYSTILCMKESLTKMFTNLSDIYYKEASHIINILPNSLHLHCTLTKFENEDQQPCDNESYEKLKSLYYTFILVQSEAMFILANAYNGKAHNIFFRMPLAELSQVVQNLIKPLKIYNLELSSILQNYQSCDVQLVQRVFRGIPTSKWQDTYIHLDLTSQRIQLAYKEITSVLEVLDLNSEQDENSLKLIETITEKMNEAYKQIENARSFAEFSSLLIAKAQHKITSNAEKQTDDNNFFPINNANRIIISADTEIEIEDEVFEEYIKEEYLKPLYENNEGIVQSFKIDKLLKKNFMSELKEALVEKQKTMTERELNALKRMYDRVRKNSIVNKTETEKSSINLANNVNLSKPVPSERKEVFPIPVLTPPSPPPPPPLPSVPPLITSRTTLIEDINEEEEEDKEELEKKNVLRTPVPLPRVKMLQCADDMPYIQKFSISECTSNFKFPSNFKIAEETFLGSGENSEEDENDKKSDYEDLIEN